MMEYHLRYRSTNVYERPTPEVCLDYLILPADLDGRKMQSYTIRTRPKSSYYSFLNRYGFRVLRFMNLSRLSEFTLEMNCSVLLEGTPPPVNERYESPNAREILRSPNFKRRNYFFLQDSPLTALDAKTLSIWAPEPGDTVFRYLNRLKNHIYTLMDYVPGVTNISTKATEALQAGQGVCQDFSHIFLGFCRSAGIPARYVSGYLFIGRDEPAQLHAWVEALVPGIGWIGIDPTNHLLTNENYIKIAHGLDYSECPSIKGVIRGAVDHSTTYEVAIQQAQQ